MYACTLTLWYSVMYAYYSSVLLVMYAYIFTSGGDPLPSELVRHGNSISNKAQIHNATPF